MWMISLYVIALKYPLPRKKITTMHKQNNQMGNEAMNSRFSTAKHIAFISPKLFNDPRLSLKGTTIPVMNQYNFLGIRFWQETAIHTTFKTSKSKVLQILENSEIKPCKSSKKLCKFHWNGEEDRKARLKLYRTQIRSKLDYGNFV